MTPQRLISRRVSIVAALCLAATTAAAMSTHRDALRAVVSGCVAAKKAAGIAFPCLDVSLPAGAPGFAVIRAPYRRTEVLLVPTEPISGIESASIEPSASSAYWQAAWQARRYVTGALGHDIPRTGLGIAANSREARSQDQLHLHVDCVAHSVEGAVRRYAGMIGHEWRRFPLRLVGQDYWARRLDGIDLADGDPITLASTLPMSQSDPDATSLAVVGAEFGGGQDGFILLATQGGPENQGQGVAETLLDHRCTER